MAVVKSGPRTGHVRSHCATHVRRRLAAGPGCCAAQMGNAKTNRTTGQAWISELLRPITIWVDQGNSAPKDWNTSSNTGTTHTKISPKIPMASIMTAVGYISAERILERRASFFSRVCDKRSMIWSKMPADSPACTMCTKRPLKCRGCRANASFSATPDATSLRTVCMTRTKLLWDMLRHSMAKACTTGTPAFSIAAHCRVMVAKSLLLMPSGLDHHMRCTCTFCSPCRRS